MPWKETHVMDERMKFIAEYLEGDWNMSELCRAYGISRPTGYELVARYNAKGPQGLRDRSRARHRHPNQTAAEIAEKVIELRKAHPRWGPRKLRGRLARNEPEVNWPAPSTIGELLKRQGLVSPRRQVRRAPRVAIDRRAQLQGPNDIWCADFKGWFRTGDGRRCEPLTITDEFSRFLLTCHAVERPDGEHTYPLFERAFCEYGLPLAIRTDNGSPFASRGVGGLSRLAVWWIKLGIRPERIDPGKPQQNGRHERMHRTLKQEIASPPCSSWHAQQMALEDFRQQYNFERPHEALNNTTPSDHYSSSPRSYPNRHVIEYPDHYVVRRVRSNGEIRMRGQLHFLGEALSGELVGLDRADDRYWHIHFGPAPLATFDDFTRTLRREPPIPSPIDTP